VAFCGSPAELTAVILNDALRNVAHLATGSSKSVGQAAGVDPLPTSPDGLTFSLMKSLPSTVFHFEMNDGYVRAEHIPLAMLLEIAYPISEQQLRGDLTGEDTYDLLYQLKGTDPGNQLLQRILDNALPDTLGIEARYHTEMTSVFDLQVDDVTKLPAPTDSPSLYHSDGDAVSGVMTMAQLSAILQGPAKHVVFDQTGKLGRFSVALSWRGQDLAVLGQSLSRIGLKLTSDERPVEFLVVTRKKH
jgi:uncharacterized protein (TIGR03435 family)